jgi:hypothetical protein
MKCELVIEQPALKVVVCYIAVSRGENTRTFAQRFVDTWIANPPGYPHRLLIICNGGRLPGYIEPIFKPLDCQFVLRQNDGGKDISAYQAVADSTNADFLVCMGESVYFHRPGWLARMAKAREQLGPGMYGFFSSFMVMAHLNTTAFGCDPTFIRQYPQVDSNGARYEFEHGRTALWRRIVSWGGRAFFVTWDGVWERNDWRMPENILWRGDQSNLLVWCNHTERYYHGDALLKFTWERNANNPQRTE